MKAHYLLFLISCLVFVGNCSDNPVDPESDPHVLVIISNGQFSPPFAEVSLAASIPIRWRNEDSEIRTVESGTSAAPTSDFKSPNLDPGEFFEHTFNNVGTFAYFSSITGATGSIRVTTNAQPCVGYGCTGN